MKNAVLLLKRRVAGLILLFIFLTTAALLFHDGGAVAAMRADAGASVRFPILMYHSVLRDPQRAGAYVISPAQLEKDLIYLKAHGYTTVLPADLVSYVNGESELPEKPIMITFDDGYYNNLVYVLPILKKLDMKAVVSIVGSFTQRAEDLMDQNPSYAHLIWADVKALADSGYVEIGSHSYGLHSVDNGREGVKRKAWETAADHETVLTGDIEMQRKALLDHCGLTVTTFAYPFGDWDKESEAVLRKAGFTVTLTCRERMNYIDRDPSSLFHLGRFNRPSGVSTETFMQRVLQDPQK